MARISFDTKDDIKKKFAIITRIQEKSMSDILIELVKNYIKKNENILPS